MAGVDREGTTTLAWSNEYEIYATTRELGGVPAKPQLVARSMSTDLRLAVAANGDAVLTWAYGRNGTVYASTRTAGRPFGPAQVIHDPVFDSPASPSVAIAPNGWAIVGVPSGDPGWTFVAALRPPGQAFGAPQRVADSTGRIPPGVGVGINSRGDALVAFGASDCPNLPPDYRCDQWLRASTAAAGGRFAEPVQIGEGWGHTPSVAVAPNGRVSVGFVACLGHNCVAESQVADADLPGPFGTPVTLAKGTSDRSNPPAGQIPALATLADGSALAWLWTETAPDILYSRRTDGGWPAVKRVGGEKRMLAAGGADAEGDVVFGGSLRSGVPTSCRDCAQMQVQRWSVADPVLTAPVALAPGPVRNGVAAPGPGEVVAAAWGDEHGHEITVRVYEEEKAPAATPPDRSAPVVAVVGQPRTPAPVMRLRATCDEACTLAAKALLRVGSRAFRMTSPSRSLAPALAGTLQLRAQRNDRTRLRRALRSRARMTLTVRIRAIDTAGNARVARRSFRFR